MNTLSRKLPSSVQCCPRCSALLDNTTRSSYQGTKHSDIRATAPDCQVCTLLRQALRDGHNQDDANVDIVRQGVALRKGATGSRLLRLCCDTGPSLIPYP
jgi:hypothetical protein